MANVCITLIILTTIAGIGSTIFGAIDYHNTEKWIAEQTKELKGKNV